MEEASATGQWGGRDEVEGDGEMTLEDEQLRPQVNGDGGKAELARANK